MTEGPRSGDSESNVADHVRLERERRGWSTAELARYVTQAGCPMSQSAVWRIESGEPRRKISVDELVAFAKVFDKRIDELLQPVSHEYPEEVVEAYAQKWVSAESEAWLKRVTARTAFADLAAVVSAYPAALPDVPKILEEEIRRSGSSHIRTEVERQLPEISRYLATMGSHDSRVAYLDPLVDHWRELGMTFEEMMAEAKRLHLLVAFNQVVGPMTSLYDSEASIGENLRRVREVRGMTLEKLHELTRIRPAIIEAIERDDFNRVINDGNHKVRSYIRTLAKRLAVDPTPLLRQFDMKYEGRPASSPEGPAPTDTGEMPRKRVARVKKQNPDQ